MWNVRSSKAQGNRISEQCQEAGEICFVPSGPLEFAAQGAFRSLFLHSVQRHVAENGQIMRPVPQSGPVLVLVHCDIEAPVQAILDTPVRSSDVVQARGR